MATQWKIGIDWRRKGVTCWNAQAHDPLDEVDDVSKPLLVFPFTRFMTSFKL